MKINRELLKRIETLENQGILDNIENIEQFLPQVQELVQKLGEVKDFEVLIGEDGKAPERGVEYMNEDDIAAIEQFIVERLTAIEQYLAGQLPVKDIDYQSIEAAKAEISRLVSQIKPIKGDKGDKGDDGSPDTGEDIVRKLKGLGKNQKLPISHIKGGKAIASQVAQNTEDIEEIQEKMEDKVRDLVTIAQPDVAAAIGDAITLVDNGDGTFTFTLNGTPTTIDMNQAEVYVDGATLVGNILTLTDNDATTPNVTIDLSTYRSTLTDNGDGTYSHNDNNGNVVVIDTTAAPYDNTTSGLTATTFQGAIDELDGIVDALDLDTSVVSNVITGNRIATHTDGDGNNVDIDETITTLIDNTNGTHTYTNESGTTTTFPTLDQERVEDIVGNQFVHANHTGVVATYDDASGEVRLAGGIDPTIIPTVTNIDRDDFIFFEDVSDGGAVKKILVQQFMEQTVVVPEDTLMLASDGSVVMASDGSLLDLTQ